MLVVSDVCFSGIFSVVHTSKGVTRHFKVAWSLDPMTFLLRSSSLKDVGVRLRNWNVAWKTSSLGPRGADPGQLKIFGSGVDRYDASVPKMSQCTMNNYSLPLSLPSSGPFIEYDLSLRTARVGNASTKRRPTQVPVDSPTVCELKWPPQIQILKDKGIWLIGVKWFDSESPL